jgi:tellurite resistance protein TerB
MSFFSALKKALGSGAREISANYSSNKNFLNAVCASAALTANADGTIEDTERNKAITLITNHDQLSKLYDRKDIEAALEHAFKASKDATGRQALARDLEGVTKLEGGAQMAEDVYLVAMDIAGADGNVSEEEQAVMAKIAKRLSVDPSKFEF